MASLSEVNIRSADNRDRIILLEGLINQIMTNTVVLPMDWVNINSAGDKTGKYVFGTKAGINDGDMLIGWKSSVPDPTSDVDFSEIGLST